MGAGMMPKRRAKRMRTLPLARKLWDEQNERYVSTRTQSAEALNSVVGLLLQHAEHREAMRNTVKNVRRELLKPGFYSKSEVQKWREAAENASTMAASYARQLQKAEEELLTLEAASKNQLKMLDEIGMMLCASGLLGASAVEKYGVFWAVKNRYGAGPDPKSTAGTD